MGKHMVVAGKDVVIVFNNNTKRWYYYHKIPGSTKSNVSLYSSKKHLDLIFRHKSVSWYGYVCPRYLGGGAYISSDGERGCMPAPSKEYFYLLTGTEPKELYKLDFGNGNINQPKQTLITNGVQACYVKKNSRYIWILKNDGVYTCEVDDPDPTYALKRVGIAPRFSVDQMLVADASCLRDNLSYNYFAIYVRKEDTKDVYVCTISPVHGSGQSRIVSFVPWTKVIIPGCVSMTVCDSDEQVYFNTKDSHNKIGVYNINLINYMQPKAVQGNFQNWKCYCLCDDRGRFELWFTSNDEMILLRRGGRFKSLNNIFKTKFKRFYFLGHHCAFVDEENGLNIIQGCLSTDEDKDLRKIRIGFLQSQYMEEDLSERLDFLSIYSFAQKTIRFRGSDKKIKCKDLFLRQK